METIKGYAQLSDVEMYYEMAGNGEPLLLIHGLDSDSRMWDRQFRSFSQFFRVIRFDCRGFGRTPMPAGKFQILDDIHDLMSEIGIESAHILGYSYGGTIAPTFALKYPGKVKSLILASPGMVGHQWSLELQDYFKRFQECYREKNDAEMLRLLKWKSIYGPYRNNTGLDEICHLVERMFQEALSIIPREGTPLPTGDTRNLLPAINVPTLVLVGELDFHDYHLIANFYVKQIPNSGKRIIPDAAHFMSLEKSERFNQEILEFLLKL